MHLIKGVYQGVFAQIRVVTEQYGLPVAALPVLAQIHGEQGITVSEISRRTGMAKSQVSTTVDGLVAQGLLEKGPDPSDQRLTRLYTTARERQQMGQMRRERDRRLGRILASIPGDRKQAVLDGLRALKAALAVSPNPGAGDGPEPPGPGRDQS